MPTDPMADTTSRYARYTTKDGSDYIAVDHGDTFVTTIAHTVANRAEADYMLGFASDGLRVRRPGWRAAIARRLLGMRP